MSWRFLLVVLLLALGASAFGGMRLGDWLVEHAPPSTPAPGQDENGTQPVLDANGRAFVAQPPQPRVDGTLGIPDKPADLKWNVQMVSLFDTVKDPSVLLSKSGMTAEQAREVAAAAQTTLPSGGSDVSTLDLMPPVPAAPVAPPIRGQISVSSGYGGAELMQQAPQMAYAQARPAPAAGANGWQGALRQELAQCANAGFFERPTCSWNARNKYCAPNQAWGSIAECPRRPGE